MSSRRLHEPWKSFLRGLDAQLTSPTELHCFGGFVIAEHYDVPRPTADIDVFAARGTDPAALVDIGGKGSPLHKRYHVYLQIVTVADVPDGYEDRLAPVLAGQLKYLRLKAFERHDLVLAKLGRNIDRDREDVIALARARGLDTSLLKSRYESELRPYLSAPEREDLTLQLWIEIIEEANKNMKV